MGKVIFRTVWKVLHPGNSLMPYLCLKLCSGVGLHLYIKFPWNRREGGGVQRLKEWHSHQFSSVQSVMFDTLWPHELQHARPPCPSPTPGGYSNSCPSSWWCHPAISSSVKPFSSCPQSLPASGSFPMSSHRAWQKLVKAKYPRGGYLASSVA